MNNKAQASRIVLFFVILAGIAALAFAFLLPLAKWVGRKLGRTYEKEETVLRDEKKKTRKN